MYVSLPSSRADVRRPNQQRRRIPSDERVRRCLPAALSGGSFRRRDAAAREYDVRRKCYYSSYLSDPLAACRGPAACRSPRNRPRRSGIAAMRIMPSNCGKHSGLPRLSAHPARAPVLRLDGVRTVHLESSAAKHEDGRGAPPTPLMSSPYPMRELSDEHILCHP
ncbi:hypothetical protein BU26DRAFT_503639 [Trematosphaeria pertusa]|uniref:Uncharacterized protein n=1 Tax=Trematosphaeria pertusa TaxID=390896 RepID=A0A6A6IKC9_9PLEO|nr:uncharacterized protein BU26DRAFT_503639 [Trematosphaeria pertusa]KAF2251065.1 hypothetical protein BU26DRAFT_503639 [Trematosphaeria pertusa]